MDELEKLISSLTDEERNIILNIIFLIRRENKEDTVSDEAFARYVHETTEFVDGMNLAKHAFDKVGTGAAK